METNPAREATIQVRCDGDHVSKLDSSSVRLAHVNGVVVGHSFFCVACHTTVVVRSSVEVVAALHEFGVQQLTLVDERFTPAVVSEDRRVLSMRLLVDHVIGDLVDDRARRPQPRRR